MLCLSNMDENEDIALLLDEFNESKNFTPALDKFIAQIASTGVTGHPWSKLKYLIAHKLDIVITEFLQRAPVLSETVSGVNTDNLSVKDMKSLLIDSVSKFDGAPFTIQRLCELMVNPTKHYKTTEKFMRSIEKTLLVVSTVNQCGIQVINERVVLQLTEPSNEKSSASSPFLTPYSPGIIHNSPSDRVQTKSSWPSSRRVPSVVNSPSLRGVVLCGFNNQRHPSSFQNGESLQRKRRHKDDIDEKSEDQPRNSEKCPRLSSLIDELSSTLHPKMAPILGQLLSNADGEDDGKLPSKLSTADSGDDVDSEKITNSNELRYCKRIANPMTGKNCGGTTSAENFAECDKSDCSRMILIDCNLFTDTKSGMASESEDVSAANNSLTNNNVQVLNATTPREEEDLSVNNDQHITSSVVAVVTDQLQETSGAVVFASVTELSMQENVVESVNELNVVQNSVVVERMVE